MPDYLRKLYPEATPAFSELIETDVPAPEPVRWERKSPHADWTIVQPDDIPHYRSVGQEIRALYTEPPSDPLRDAAPDILASLDPETLEAIADEITNGDRAFLHSARAGSLRSIAKRQRAAIAKAEGR